MKNDLDKEIKNLNIGPSNLKEFLSERRFRDLQYHKSLKDRFPLNQRYYRQMLVETAVTLSQLNVIKKSVDNNENILMLEDDFGPSTQFYNIHNHRLHRQINWSLLYYGDCPSMRSGLKTKLIKRIDSTKCKLSANSLIKSYAVCHQSLAFRPSFGKKIFKKNHIIPMKYPIDDQVSQIIQKYKVPYALYDKPIFIQDVNLGIMSNIQNSQKCKWELQSSDKFGVFELHNIRSKK